MFNDVKQAANVESNYWCTACMGLDGTIRQIVNARWYYYCVRRAIEQTEGNIILSEADVEALGLKPKATAQGEMIWTGNESYDQAKQLNGPAGELVWQSNAKMKWEKNVARGNSKQINGPASGDVMKDFWA